MLLRNRQQLKRVMWGGLLSMLLIGCAASSGAPQAVSVSGAWALYPLIVKWAEEYQRSHPGVQFDLSAGGTGKGVGDVLAGQVDLGMASRGITAEEKQQGAVIIEVARDAVFPTMNAANPVVDDLLQHGLTRDQLRQVFITGEITQWGQLVDRPEITDKIHVYTRSDAAGAPEIWADYLGAAPEDLQGIAVYGDPAVIDAVIKDPLSLGYDNLNYAYDPGSGRPVTGALIPPLDINGNGRADAAELLNTRAQAMESVATGQYPATPARTLSLVTRGQPIGAVKDFLIWVLTDGQQFVAEAGYIPLTAAQLADNLQQLK